MKKTTGRLRKTRTIIGLDMAKAMSRLLEMQEAARIPLQHQFLGTLPRSGKLPRADLLVPIAKALGVTVPDLLGEPRSAAPSRLAASWEPPANKSPTCLAASRRSSPNTSVFSS